MPPAESGRARGRRLLPSVRTSRWTAGGTGVAFLALAAWAAIDAASFARTVADFGPYNAHLVRDFAAFSATCGVGLLASVRVPSWRIPVLAMATLWNALHAVSHLVDAHAAEPAYVGPLEFGAIVVAAAALGLCTATERRHARTTVPGDHAPPT